MKIIFGTKKRALRTKNVSKSINVYFVTLIASKIVCFTGTITNRIKIKKKKKFTLMEKSIKSHKMQILFVLLFISGEL